IKYGKTHIVAMYICITSNGPIENLYKKLRQANSSIDINAFIQRVKFIIKFEGNPVDSETGKGNIIYDITDQIIINIPKSKPGERVIAFSSNKNYQNTERKINTVEAILSKKQNQNDNLIEEPDLQAELSGYNSSFSAY
ncbi:956_t:CDS:2, partial [Dentiscutata heterogama]